MRQTWLILLTLLLLGDLRPGVSAETTSPSRDPLQEQTQQAQDRVRSWEAEDRRQEKRNSWELPVAVALIAAGAAFASHDMTYAYSASFAAATGLTLHFYISGP